MQNEATPSTRISFVMEGHGRSIRIPPRRNWVLIVTTGCFWLLLIYTGFKVNALLDPEAGADPLTRFLLWVFLCVGFLPWLHATCFLIWQILGVETITILDGKLLRVLSVPYLSFRKTYDLAEIDNFRWLQRYSAWDVEPISSPLYGMRYGAIQFNNGTQIVTIAKGVDRQKCQEIIEAIAYAADPRNG